MRMKLIRLTIDVILGIFGIFSIFKPNASITSSSSQNFYRLHTNFYWQMLWKRTIKWSKPPQQLCLNWMCRFQFLYIYLNKADKIIEVKCVLFMGIYSLYILACDCVLSAFALCEKPNGVCSPTRYSVNADETNRATKIQPNQTKNKWRAVDEFCTSEFRWINM